MIRFQQLRPFTLLLFCCTLAACSSGNTADTPKAESDTGVAASAAAPVAAIYGGAVDGISCSYISGWAWNSANLNEKIMVDVLVDDKVIGTTPAISPRLDLQKISASPNFGFAYAIPPDLKDGKPHTVKAKISGASNEIKVWENIKPSFTCSPKSK